MVTPNQLAVLGSMLIDETCVGTVLSETHADDFLDADCRILYLAARSLFNEDKPVDPVTVLAAAGQGKDSGLYDLVKRAMVETPSAANVGLYLPLLREEARLHKMQVLGLRLAEAKSGEEAREAVARLQELTVDKPGLRVVDMEQAVGDWYRRMNSKPDYLSWGFRELDERMYIEPGDFAIIGGYPSTGKTAFALGVAWHMSGKYRVGFYSLETNDAKLTDRLMSRVALLSMGKMKRRELSEEDYQAVAAKTAEITGHRLEFIDAAGMTADDILATAKARKHQVVFIDYVQLIEGGSGENRTQQLSEISRKLHLGGQTSGITIVGLSQLSRPVKADGKRKAPRMSDLRESGQLEQDADTIMLLYLENADDPKGRRVLAVEKNKEGETGMMYLAFDGEHQAFRKHYDQEPPKLPKRQKQDGEQYNLSELKGHDPDCPF